jgi:serine/threonine-protein kinase
VEFLYSEDIGGGFAMIFRWTNGECMGKMYPQSCRKFLQADISTKLNIFRDILSFFNYVSSCGYVAIDFYDGCIIYDFEKHKTIICDVDYFRKKPAVNERGRMWGSTRFMSPEEFQLGAVLDEVTNVYTLGATAFVLLITPAEIVQLRRRVCASPTAKLCSGDGGLYSG